MPRPRQLLWTTAGSPVHLLLVSISIISKFSTVVQSISRFGRPKYITAKALSQPDFQASRPSLDNCLPIPLYWQFRHPPITRCCTADLWRFNIERLNKNRSIVYYSKSQKTSPGVQHSQRRAFASGGKQWSQRKQKPVPKPTPR
jgi:hypothetical protein